MLEKHGTILEKQDHFIQEQKAFNKTILKKLEKLETFQQEQKEINLKQREFNKIIIEKLEALELFNKKLFIAIENEIVDRLMAESDHLKTYTNKRIEAHTNPFQQELRGHFR